MQEVELGGEKSFVGAWLLSDLKICDELIQYFHAKEGKVEGEIGHDRIGQQGHQGLARPLHSARDISTTRSSPNISACLREVAERLWREI